MNPKGFTLRMIHKNSEESPLYNPLDHLMTQEEIFQTLIDQSRARTRYIASQINPDVFVRVLYDEGAFYHAASVGIGTFPGQPGYMSYYLLVDSGSDLTWLQCRGATQFFHQDSLLYPWQDSQSYRLGRCRNTSADCRICNGSGVCVYKETYVDSQVTYGVLANENFTFSSRTSPSSLVSFQLRMGCGLRQVNFNLGKNGSRQKPDFIAGILGLGRGLRSFVSQLTVGGGKFSYCFEKYSRGNTYLSFGEDARIGDQARSTPFAPINNFNTSFYYLNLEGITVGGLTIPRREFEYNHNKRTGGCIIDSGAPFTTMYKNIYVKVKDYLEGYFLNYYGIRPAAFSRGMLCFKTKAGQEYRKPNIIFHFQQSDYNVSESEVWYEIPGHVCLGMVSSDSNKPALTFGALQQVNKRILYDNLNLRLSFADENC
ncbi:aspartic proteinase nepenthesin-2-like [Papaver somniferum]|uniref:aspartic proteinase nepenthesin-2-like n=1 Tax=Papaver somniferum TaxID=3469 RepID=UPI000E700086|nr:aspartic proteinase nepenthesin-2-like [Papaver somniferum]